MAVGDYKSSVMFQNPADDGRSYRVSVVIPKPAKDPPVKAERIEVWLLARDGKGLTLASRDRPGGLVEAGNDRGVTANAIFFFRPEMKRAELVAVVVSVDGELTTFKVPPAGAKANRP